LEDGHSILFFPEGPTGAPAHLSRFRLDAIHAAVVTSSPIHPIGIRGTSSILQPEKRAAGRREAKVLVGHAIRSEMAGHRDLIGLRERVREAIAELCR
jgi:1-acyl-sn-glycerol-3-phosphate acyltransferase